jgi:hypothetical protein
VECTEVSSNIHARKSNQMRQDCPNVPGRATGLAT